MNNQIKYKLSHIPKSSGVYQIIINKSRYIGSSINMHKRIRHHIYQLLKQKHINKNVQNAFNACDEMHFKVLELVKEGINQLIGKEQYYLDILQPELNIYRHATHNKKKGRKNHLQLTDAVVFAKVQHIQETLCQTHLHTTLKFLLNNACDFIADKGYDSFLRTNHAPLEYQSSEQKSNE